MSLVLYGTKVKLTFGLMRMTEKNRKSAKAHVSSIGVGTSTNLCGGLLKGKHINNYVYCQLLEENFGNSVMQRYNFYFKS